MFTPGTCLFVQRYLVRCKLRYKNKYRQFLACSLFDTVQVLQVLLLQVLVHNTYYTSYVVTAVQGQIPGTYVRT